MRVALVTNILPPYRVPVFRALAATPGWALRVFLSARSEHGRNWEFATGGLDVELVRGLKFRRHVRSRDGLQQMLTTHLPWSLPIALLRFRPDVVISGELGARSWLAWLVCRILGIPLVVWTYHSRSSFAGTHRIGRVLRRMLLARAAAVVGMGSQARQILGELGVESSRIFDAPNAHDQESIASAASRVDVDAFRRKLEAEFACRSRIALVVGRLVPAKGIVFLLQSWERLPEKIRDEWTLLFIGSGPLASLLEETMADSSDGEIVQLPAVQPAELIPYYAASSLLIFPSLSDPWGLVVNEALACGLPVLCSRLAGCADDLIQPGRNGWLVDPTDPADLYRALVETLSRLDLEALRGAALETAERFRPEAMADGMRNAVSFALRSAGEPSRS